MRTKKPKSTFLLDKAIESSFIGISSLYGYSCKTTQPQEAIGMFEKASMALDDLLSHSEAPADKIRLLALAERLRQLFLVLTAWFKVELIEEAMEKEESKCL